VLPLRGRTEINMRMSISKKIYMEIDPPDTASFTADKDRIIRALKKDFGDISFPMKTFQKYYKLLRDFDWKLTVTMIMKGYVWEIIRIERGNTTDVHYGFAADLGSTTIAMQLVNLNTGRVLAEKVMFNSQRKIGDEILSRIFYVKDNDLRLSELQKQAADDLNLLIGDLCKASNISQDNCSVMVISGNTTMIHFLLGFDPWFIFHNPYTPAFNSAEFVPGENLGLTIPGFVYCLPSAANYIGGDTISGLLASGMYHRSELALYMDFGTNGEMVLGNNTFLLSAAGAAGPALEGGISKQGMPAKPGAIDSVRITKGDFAATTIQNEKPIGICGSGIVDLLAEMFLEGWIDPSGAFVPGKSERIVTRENMYCVVYAWAHESGTGEECLFTQRDIFSFMETKAAANTMVSYLLETYGIGPGELKKVYLAGAFGRYLNLESAITIGLYPDLPRDRFTVLGNASLLGAYMLLTDAKLYDTAESLIEKIDYLSLGEAQDFLTKMYAAKFLPHTDLDAYPSVQEKLKQRRT
jgi:uncharacterized 2Fe-2S/4Fe-4S cluster protein (DUF4445 family)